MTASLLNIVVLLIAILAAGCWYFYGPHQDYWEELTRNRLFTIRSKLFQSALNGHVNFDDRAYQIMRMTINGMIRYVHDIGFFAVLTSILSNRALKLDLSARYEERLSTTLSILQKEGKQAVLTARADMHLVVLIHIYHTSLPLWMLMVPVVNLLRLIHLLNRVQRWTLRGNNKKGSWPALDETALQIGLAVNPSQAKCITPI